MSEINDPISTAQRIVRSSLHNFGEGKTFYEISSIYKFTNENIYSYLHHLKNKKRMLSVIASGNQILNAILVGTKNIDCFDISIFPEYYLFLQIASVLALSREEYLDYYLSDDREVVFSDVLYDKVREYLAPKYKEFWDSLYNFDEGYDIYNSLLFRTDPCYKSTEIDRNPYLFGDNYYKLKEILQSGEVSINPSVFDITQTKIDRDYDLVYLSNILTYNFSVEEYVEYLKSNFNIAKGGEVINYFYGMDPDVKDKFINLLGEHGSIEELGDCKLLVYKR